MFCFCCLRHSVKFVVTGCIVSGRVAILVAHLTFLFSLCFLLIFHVQASICAPAASHPPLPVFFVFCFSPAFCLLLSCSVVPSSILVIFPCLSTRPILLFSSLPRSTMPCPAPSCHVRVCDPLSGRPISPFRRSSSNSRPAYLEHAGAAPRYTSCGGVPLVPSSGRYVRRGGNGCDHGTQVH